MKGKFSLILIIALIFALTLTLSSCDLFKPSTPPEDPPTPGPEPEPAPLPDDTPTVDLSGVSFLDFEGVYDGKPHSIFVTGTLPEGVTVAYEGNGVKDAGEYTVSAKFYLDGKQLEGKDKTAKITITRATYDMSGVSLMGATVVKSGRAESLAVSGTLPKGVTVSYSGGDAINVGEYTVTASFAGDAKNYEAIPSMTAKLRIIDGPAAFGGARLSDLTAEYNGKTHALAVTGVSSSVSVSYVGNSKINAGEYTVTASLTSATETMNVSASLVIKPATIKATAVDTEVQYNGKKQSIALTWDGLKPAGVNVSVIGNEVTAPGVYDVRFRFTVDESVRGNFVYHPDINVKLTITAPKSLATEGLTFKYDTGTGKMMVSGYQGTDATVIIPESYKNDLGVTYPVRGIMSGAFMNNKTVTSVYMPSGVDTIGASAFRGCTALRSVTFGQSLKVIGPLAFAETALRDAAIPSGVTAIGQSAFRGCEKLERITLPFIGGSKTTSNPYIGYIFGANGYVANETYLPESLKVVILSDNCTDIPAYSFFGADSIEEVVIGSGVRTIGISAFQGCVSLIGLYIPAGVTDVPAAAKVYNSPVYGCGEGFIVGTGIASRAAHPTGWGKYCDIVAEDTRADVRYDVTYEEYLAIVIGERYFEK